jgi:SAM-dependent methyltransferase
MPSTSAAGARAPADAAPEPSRRTERAVAEFYDRLVFPSRSSDPAYRALLPATPGERIGDFGCGQSLFHDALRAYAPPPIFLDLSMNALRTIEHGHRVRADLAGLPFKSGVFDRILCIGVLHHLPDRAPALRHLARVLRPRGRLILGVYSPRSVQSILRRLHEASSARAWRRFVAWGTRRLLEARYRRAGTPLAPEDSRRRARDFLEVPYVRYAPAADYVREAERFGLRAAGLGRISGMNIIHLERT